MKHLFTLLFIFILSQAIGQDGISTTMSKVVSIKNARNVNDSLTILKRSSRMLFYPTVTFQNPTSPGYFGLVVLGGTLENRTRIANYPDANVAAYVGLGEPEKFIGAGVTINIYGLSNTNGEQNNQGQGSMSLHLNRFLLNRKLLLDAGVDNLIFWGGEQEYISYQRSFYFSGNYTVGLSENVRQKPFSYLSITAGAGNGYYRTDKHYTLGKSGSFDPFITLATPIFKGTNIITEWNGYDIGTGISSIPVQKIPFMFTFEVTDLIYKQLRFISSISIPFNFKKRKKTDENLPMMPVFVKPIRSVRTM